MPVKMAGLQCLLSRIRLLLDSILLSAILFELVLVINTSSELKKMSISRVDIFRNGEKAMQDKNYESAIELFKKCMKMLSEQGQGLSSQLFPQCLENLAECHKETDKMEEALSFKKFEKLYYETVLLNSSDTGTNGLNMKMDPLELERGKGDGESVPIPKPQLTEKELQQPQNRANEYEQLSQLCLQNKCISLALEYSGKATILRRHHYGNDHEETKRSFEMFTSIYAEAAKQQYSESMTKANIATGTIVSDAHDTIVPKSADNVEDTLLTHRKIMGASNGESQIESKPIRRTRSILKKGSSDTAAPSQETTQENTSRRVRFSEPLPVNNRLLMPGDTDNSGGAILIFLIICILVVLISILVSALICNIRPETMMCVQFRHDLKKYYRKFEFLYNRNW